MLRIFHCNMGIAHINYRLCIMHIQAFTSNHSREETSKNPGKRLGCSPGKGFIIHKPLVKSQVWMVQTSDSAPMIPMIHLRCHEHTIHIPSISINVPIFVGSLVGKSWPFNELDDFPFALKTSTTKVQRFPSHVTDDARVSHQLSMVSQYDPLLNQWLNIMNHHDLWFFFATI